MKHIRLFALFAVLCVAGSAFAIAQEKTSLTFEAKDGAGKGKHVVLLAGDEEYRSEESLPMLAKILSQRHGFKCTVLFSVEPDGTINPENTKSLSNPEALDSADAIIMALRFRDWPDATMEKFDNAYRRGVPIVALRTSTHAFNIPKDGKWAKYSYNNEGPDWPKGFGRQVLGETWVAHHGEHKKEATRGYIEDGAENEPLLRGAKDFFGQTDVYAANPSADAKVLVRGAVLTGMKPTDPKVKGAKNEPMQPIVWTRVAKNEAGNINKVLTTTMGSADDLLNESLRRLVVNGVYWGLGIEVPKRADVNFVEEYKPTFYGFKEHRKGVKVADLERKETPKVAEAKPADGDVLTGDTLEITGSESAEQNGVFPVQTGGYISVPKVGRVYVSGKSLSAAEALIKRALGSKTLQVRKLKPGEVPVPKAVEVRPATKVEAVAAPAIDLLKPAARPGRPALLPSALPLGLIQGERVALVGNSLGEHFNKYGYFETLLHSRFPKSELIVRNFCFPADEVGARQRSAGYTNLDDPQLVFGADTYICFFGFNESFAGPAGVAKFKENYGKFLDDTAKNYPRDDTKAAPRFVLVSPMAFEVTGQKFLPDGKKENENLKLYAAAVGEVAKERNLAFVDLFEPTAADFLQKPGMQFTTNGAHTNEEGDREVSETLDRALFGTTNPAKIGSPDFERLRAAVNDKAWVHMQDYRMLNGWYVYGGRNTHDKETFPREFVKIRSMAAVRDRYVWDLAQSKRGATKPDDSKTGELFVPKTMFGTQPTKEPKEIKYPTPEQSIATMKVPEGFEVQLVASEREFPQLAKVHQINFDNKGRLWAACMPTYPQWLPGQPKPNDRLLIFDNLEAKGKAKTCKVFYDKLVCPTGFEFWNGGVIVVDEPRLLFLKDTDGDDKADLVVELSDGWATDDTHHTIGAFEWSPGGLLHMLEGVSLATAVETPWGPVRQQGKPGCYVLDPRAQKLRHFVTPGYGNPWCYVFNWWGQGIVGDGTTPQQHWDTPLSSAPYAGRKGMNTVFDGEGMRPNVGTEFIYTRQFPDDVQGNFIFACVINMNGLTTFTLGDDGAGFKGARKKKTVKDASGVEKQVPDDLLSAVDNMVFRPTDPQIGPDGALYFGDWSAALIGHMQYSQRDPNRDHTHGRLYRLVYKSKPLLKPVTQAGKPVYELLEQLKEYEPRTRYRARRELRDRPTPEVLAQINKWVANLNPIDKEFDRLLLEALWVEQGHHAVDPALLQKVLRTKTGEARAGATRVLADEWERIPNAMELIKAQVVDEFPRTRAEAIRALSFVRSAEAVETMLLAADKPRDYWIDYTLQMSLGALEGVWKPALENNQIATNNAKGLELLREVEEQSKPGGAAAVAVKKYLTQTGASKGDKEKLIKEIAKGKGVADTGKAVFRRICIACHKWGGEGIEYGPHMDGVATRLKREEIVESVLEPNAKIDPKFATTNIETNSGGAFTGFIVAETPEALTLAMAGGLKQEIKVAEVKKRETIQQSSMPEGLANGMSPGEFLDLVEFLSTLKAAK